MRSAFAAVWRNPYIRVLVFSVLAVALYLFFARTSDVWFLSIAAFLLAYLVYPLLDWSQRRFHARWLGFGLFLLALLVLLGLVVLLITGLVQQAVQFSQTLPERVSQITGDAQSLPLFIQDLPLPASARVGLQQAYGATVNQLGNATTAILNTLQGFIVGGGLFGTITTVVSGVIKVVALVALTVYLLLSFPKVQRFLVRLPPKPYHALSQDLMLKFEHAVGGYFRGQLIVASAVGIIVGVGFALLGVPLALSLGFLAGAFNLIPYLGVIVSTLPALLLALGGGWFKVVGVLVVVTIANQLESHILSPIVLGRSTRLHPAVIIIAILLGASLGGIWGALIAVPLAAFAKLLYEDYYQTSRFYEEG